MWPKIFYGLEENFLFPCPGCFAQRRHNVCQTIVAYEGRHIMTLSIISTMAAEELGKIYTHFILKLFSKCHIAQQKTMSTLLRGQQAQHRSLRMPSQSTLCKQRVCRAIKPYSGTTFFWFST